MVSHKTFVIMLFNNVVAINKQRQKIKPYANLFALLLKMLVLRNYFKFMAKRDKHRPYLFIHLWCECELWTLFTFYSLFSFSANAIHKHSVVCNAEFVLFSREFFLSMKMHKGKISCFYLKMCHIHLWQQKSRHFVFVFAWIYLNGRYVLCILYAWIFLHHLMLF